MMGGRTYGNGFKGALNYNEDKNHLHEKDATILKAFGVSSWINKNGQLCIDSNAVAREFRVQANLAPNEKKPVANWWQSYKPEDTPRLTDELMVEVAEEHISQIAVKVIGWETLSMDRSRVLTKDEADKERQLLRKNGVYSQLPKRPILEHIPLNELQYVIVKHGEKEHQHTHSLINRVTTKGDVIYTGNDLLRNVKACKDITTKYNFAWGEEKSIRTPSKQYKTSGREARDYIAHNVKAQMHKCIDADTYISELARNGITAKIGKDSTGSIVTVSYAYTTADGITHPFKGSDLGKGYSGFYLKKALIDNLHNASKSVIYSILRYARRCMSESELINSHYIAIQNGIAYTTVEGKLYPLTMLNPEVNLESLRSTIAENINLVDRTKREFREEIGIDAADGFICLGYGLIPVVVYKIGDKKYMTAKLKDGWYKYDDSRKKILNEQVSRASLNPVSTQTPVSSTVTVNKINNYQKETSLEQMLINEYNTYYKGKSMAVKAIINEKLKSVTFMVKYQNGNRIPVTVSLINGHAVWMPPSGQIKKYTDMPWITKAGSTIINKLNNALTAASHTRIPCGANNVVSDDFDELVRALIESGMTPTEAIKTAQITKHI